MARTTRPDGVKVDAASGHHHERGPKKQLVGTPRSPGHRARVEPALIVLDRCHDLAVHHDIKTGVVVLEYASEGRVVSTGAPYTNRYISVLTITDRKVTHWRDYLDPVAVFDALGWPSR